jgi:CBS domain-containing protein
VPVPFDKERGEIGFIRGDETMKVRDAMTSGVRIANPDETIREAARMMAEIDAGVLPVGQDDRLVGMITDRDIAIRAVDARIGDVMTREVRYCFEDEDLDHVCRNLADQQIRRIPVVDRDKRLVGILSLSDLALTGMGAAMGETLADISRPGGRHSQRADGQARTM